MLQFINNFHTVGGSSQYQLPSYQRGDSHYNETGSSFSFFVGNVTLNFNVRFHLTCVIQLLISCQTSSIQPVQLCHPALEDRRVVLSMGNGVTMMMSSGRGQPQIDVRYSN